MQVDSHRVLLYRIRRPASHYLHIPAGFTSFKQHPVFVTGPNKQPLAPRRKRALFWRKKGCVLGRVFFLSFFSLLSEILFRNAGLDFVFFLSVDPGSEPKQKSGLWLFESPKPGAGVCVATLPSPPVLVGFQEAGSPTPR